jgi:ceramide glucosyltransferase
MLAMTTMLCHLLTIGLCWLRDLRNPDPAGMLGEPGVTLLRPVCGLDSFAAETIASSFTQDYREYEVIFCVQSPSDVSIPLLQSLVAAYPAVKARVLIGDLRICGNPKLNNLSKGWAAADKEWICMADSNLLLPPDYLKTVVSTWDSNTGLVSSPPIGTQPQGFVGSLECAFLNSNQARLQLAADMLGLGFAQGKTLFWRRELLERNGGLAALAKNLAEDVAATKLVRSLDRKVRLPLKSFGQPIGRREFREVWHRQLRWSRVRRDGFPLLFVCEVLNGPLLPFLSLTAALWLLDRSQSWCLLYAAFWYGAEILLAARMGWVTNWRDIPSLFLRDILLPVIWAATFADRRIIWRGTLQSPNVIQPTQSIERNEK